MDEIQKVSEEMIQQFNFKSKSYCSKFYWLQRSIKYFKMAIYQAEEDQKKFKSNLNEITSGNPQQKNIKQIQ